MMDIQHKQIRFYLTRMGWSQEKSNRNGIAIFVEPTEDEPIEVLLPIKDYDDNYDLYIRDALGTIAIVENREVDQIVSSIKNIDNDILNYRIENFSKETISIALLRGLMDSVGYSLKEAARFEHSKVYDKLSPKIKKQTDSPRNEANKFVRDCKFAHTWHGSFGVTIEVPLWLPSLTLFDEISDTLGRKASKRVLQGYNLVSEAVNKNSSNYILDNINDENDILILEHHLGLQNYLQRSKIDMNISLSPLIIFENEKKMVSKTEINSKSLRFLDSAISQVKIHEKTSEIDLIGFPEVIRAPKKDLLSDIDESARRVTVKGTSRQVGHVSFRMELSLEDYKKAIRAHDEVKNVKVVCVVKRKIRGWEVVNVKSFTLLD
jgi:hypothetical protein